MSLVAIGGNSRNVGKTGLAVSLIEATREYRWTAVKITQFGHGVCSRNGRPCGCAVEDPQCPYEITAEDGLVPSTDTARMLRAGAEEVLWARVALGKLAMAAPALRDRLEGRSNVLIESNGIVAYWQPDVYLAVLQFDVSDCKASFRQLAGRADAFVLPRSARREPAWAGFDPGLVGSTPGFEVESPTFCTPSLVEFVKARLGGAGPGPNGEIGAATF